MLTTKKVAPPVVAVKPAKTVKKRTSKVLSSSEFMPLLRTKESIKKPIRKTKEPRLTTETRNLKSKKIPSGVQKHIILSDSERSQLQPRGSQMVRYLIALPRISLSPTSVQIVSVTSRSIGVAIACVGIAYSLFGSLIGVSALTQTAQVINYATSTIQNIDCTLAINFSNLECQGAINTKPVPTITIADGGATLSGIVPVRVAVDHAEIVRMRLVTLDGQIASTWLGTVFNQSTNDWQRKIDTSAYPNGQYRLLVYVSNTYGGYETFGQTTYSFINSATILPTSTTTTTASSSTTGTAPIQTTDTITINSVTTNVTESTNSFIFTIMVSPVEKVILSAVHTETGKMYTIGDAKEIDSGQWRRMWDTGSLPFGQYRLKVRAISDTNSKTIDSILVKKVESVVAVDTNPVDVIPLVLKPPVSISVLAASPLRSMVGISIDVAHASSVELALQPKSALRYSQLGRAVRSGISTWVYRFDTTMVPDGEYNLKAFVKNQYGEYETIKTGIIVKNFVEKVLTETETEEVKVLESIASKVISAPIVTNSSATVAVSEPIVPLTVNNIEPTDARVESPLVSPLDQIQQSELQQTLDRLSVAIRMSDESEVARITGEIALYKEKIQDVASERALIETYIANIIKETEEKVARTNTIIEERTKQKAAQDSDQDKVSDYDEVNIYATNPFLADSDNDGFIDGVEILRGYDPTNSKPETLVQFESPKESGVVREDILKIKSITTAPALSEIETSPKEAAVISGVALPNSFITLFIYSTPIIVTIRTDTDGSWNYRLDKELEDGEHEMYIGVTDNAGKIVAKSSSFAFIKRAEAFTGVVVDTPATVTSDEDSSLLSEYVVYLVLGISTLAIGLILMMLGLQLQARKTEVIVAE